MENTFRLRAYGLSELATLYYPHRSPSWARRCLNHELSYELSRPLPGRHD